MPPAVSELAILASERMDTHALDRAVTGVSKYIYALQNRINY